VVGLTPRPLYLRVKNLWHALSRRLGGPESQSLRMEKRSRLPLPRIEQSFIAHPNRNIFTDCAIPGRADGGIVLFSDTPRPCICCKRVQ